MKKIIEVPHYAQYIDVDDDFWQSRSCGIVSLGMILDYYGIEVPIAELIKKGKELGGYIKNVGWKHDSIVDLARIYGFKCNRTEEEKIENLLKSIEKDEPVIISIHKKFNTNNGGHLAVLTGYYYNEKDNELIGVYINDPIGFPYKFKNQFVKIETFMQGWKKRAIYIKK
ncbi:MAG: C39 family peptidase [Patescibacteria group bacterium]|nr:C39 family peptidase [Patescibacteria group bacterium]